MRSWARRLTAAAAAVLALSSAAPAHGQANGTAAQVAGDERARLYEQLGDLADHGRFADALPLAERLVALAEKDPRRDATRFAEDLVMLAWVYLGNGDPKRAEIAARRALDRLEQALGREHLATAKPLDVLGRAALALGDASEAEARFRRAQAARLAALPKDDPALADSLGALAAVAQHRGDYGRAEVLILESLAIREKRGLAVGHTLNNLAFNHDAKGEIGKAEEIYRRVYALEVAKVGEESPSLATVLNNLAGVVMRRGDHREAEKHYLRALALRRKALPEGHPLIAASLGNLGVLYVEMGLLDRAEPLFRQGLAMREKSLGKDHRDVATAVDTLAGVLHERGLFGEAEALYGRALAIREKALGEDHQDVALSLQNLASLRADRGALGEARTLFDRALRIDEEALGAGHPDVATILQNIGVVEQTQGRYVEADAHLARALALREKAFGPDHPDVLVTLQNRATLAWYVGDLDQALAITERALAMAKRVLGDDHPKTAVVLGNLGAIRGALHDSSGAETCHRAAAAITEKKLGPDHPTLAVALSNLAVVHATRGELDQAEALVKRTLAIWTRALGPDHANVGGAIDNLAGLARQRGEPVRAEDLYRKALAVREKALGKAHPDVAVTLGELSATLGALGRYEEARRVAERAAEIEDGNAAAVLGSGDERQRRAYMSTLGESTDAIVSLAARHAPAQRLGLTVVLRRKGRVLDSMVSTYAALRRGVDEGAQATLDRLAAVEAELSARLWKGGEKAAAPALAALEAERQRLAGELSRRSAAFAAERRPVTIEEVAAAIPEGAALVEIARYRTHDPRAARLEDRWGPHRYAAWVLHRRGEPAFVDLGPAMPIDGAVDRLYVALASSTPDARPAARSLDALVMARVRPLLGDARRVLLSLDDKLAVVPFGALVDEAGRYLIEDREPTYLASGRDVLRFAEHAPPRQGPLLLGGPDFGPPRAASAPHASSPPAGEVRGLRAFDPTKLPSFSPLPGTLAEVRAVRALLPGGAVLVGSQATEGAIKGAHAPSLLHLATHGFFVSDRDEDRKRPERALLRAGVALAGANGRAAGTDDGILTALEASDLDLHGTQLVVLSACQTGLGSVIAGEGVYGLRRAMAMAGAETLVLSLWNLPDRTTTRLMEGYYARLRRGLGRSEAMRAVQLAALGDGEMSHPGIWAAFIVSGNPAPLDWGRVEPARAAPGSRGCACTLTALDDEGAEAAALALGSCILAAARRRARSARARPGGRSCARSWL